MKLSSAENVISVLLEAPFLIRVAPDEKAYG